MPFPTTEQGLAEAGYVFEGCGRCRSCDAEIAWYRTPKNRPIPLDEGTLVAHFTTCPDADKFRKPRPGTGPLSASNDGYKGGPK